MLLWDQVKDRLDGMATEAPSPPFSQEVHKRVEAENANLSYIIEDFFSHGRDALMASFFDLFKGRKPSPLIQRALDDMQVMLETTHDMFVAATAHLLDNESLTVDLQARDAVVNRKEADIRRAVLEHVAIDPEHEIVFSLVLVSIVQDAERIGDLTKSLAETAALARKPRMGSHTAQLRGFRDSIEHQFATTRTAFVEGDAVKAQKVMQACSETKGLIAAFIQDLAEQADGLGNEALVLGLAARMMGRVGSHLSNIASSVALPYDRIRQGDESI